MRATVDDDLSAFVTTLDVQALARRGRSLADALRRVPGARVRDYGGLGQYATVSLRASTAEQVTVLVDGVPQNRALGGPVDLSSISTGQLESVRVYRGFAPASAGLGGVGGLIDVRTRRPAGSHGGFDLQAGSLESRRLSAGAGWRLPGAAAEGDGVQLGAEWLAGDGDFDFFSDNETPFNPADDRRLPRRNNAIDRRSAQMQIRHSTRRGGEFRLLGRTLRRKRGVPGLGSFTTTQASLRERQSDLILGWQRRSDDPRWRELDVQLDGFEQRLRYRDLDGELGIGVQDQTTRMEGAGLQAAWRFGDAELPWFVRSSWRRERVRVEDAALSLSDRGGARRQRYGVTLERTLRWNRLTLVPSVGAERIEDEFIAAAAGTIPAPSDDVDDLRWSSRLGWLWAVGPRTALRGSFGRFERTPNLTELFGDRGAVQGNPQLRPERAWSGEAGVERRWDGGTWDGRFEAVLFGRDTDDLILLIPNGQATAIPVNVSRAEVRGIELAGSAQWGRFLIDGGATWQRAVDRSGSPSDGNPLVLQPQQLGFAGAAGRWGGLACRWELTYSGSNATDSLDTPALRLPARWVHDLELRYDLPEGWAVGLEVRNVFDREVRDVARYPLPARVVLANLGWRHGGTR